jgi:putative membrane protein
VELVNELKNSYPFVCTFKKFIFTYVFTPFGFVFSLGYWVLPVVAFIFYVLVSLELTGRN